jgi:hypothetical protein
MVRLYTESSCLYKVWRYLQLMWEIVMLFIVSLLSKNPREATRQDATPFRTNPIRPASGDGSWGGSGGGGGGTGGPGPGGAGGPSRRPGSNINGLSKFRGVMRMPMGGGG